ncbi:separase-like [Miscanthus floridulus]|uniref:separase-like n=1 Tax=Miscanthus floridulus TaxID=154761 RepID=UPI00345762F7
MEAAAADLVAALSSPSSYAGLHSRFAAYLQPFTPYLPSSNPNPKPPPKRATKHNKHPPPPDAATLRLLAKRFLTFLGRAFHLLPPLVRASPGSGDKGGEAADELLEIYGLLLDCLEAISPCLAGKPYSVLLHRGRFVCCLESCGHLARANAEAAATLDALRSALSPPITSTKSRRGAASVDSVLLPDPGSAGEAGTDPEVTVLAVELTACLANCSSKGKVKEPAPYERLLSLFKQLKPWLRILTNEVRRKYLPLLVNGMSWCTFFLVSESSFFSSDLVHGFCHHTVQGCVKEGMIEHLPAIAPKICYSVDLSWGGSTQLLLHVLETVSDSVVRVKDDLPKSVNELLVFVAYFSRFILSTKSDLSVINKVVISLSCTQMSQGDNERRHEKHGTLLTVLGSAIKFSFVTKKDIQKSLGFIVCAISSKWLTPEELKFLIPSLGNIGVTLLNTGHVKEAPKALELCCQTIWAHVRLSYCRLSSRTNGNNIMMDLPMDTLKDMDIILDAFSRIAKMVDALCRCGTEIETTLGIVAKSLSKLLSDGDNSEYFRGSFILIKAWVKAVHKDFGDNKVDDAPLLYPSLLKYRSSWPIKLIGLIVEQELLAYGLTEARSTEFCSKMQIRIIDEDKLDGEVIFDTAEKALNLWLEMETFDHSSSDMVLQQPSKTIVPLICFLVDLLSMKVTSNDQSTFLAGCLYYDLSERVFSRGQLFQAFSYGKEALHLRKKLLKKKFKLNSGISGYMERQHCGQDISLEVCGPTVVEIWPNSIRSIDMRDSFLTPWNVLRCYLESTLQVAVMHELIGNGAEAEALLRTGKEISNFHGLSVFCIVFTSSLGQLYCKRQLWDEAESELNYARDLVENDATISCLQVTCVHILAINYRFLNSTAFGLQALSEEKVPEGTYEDFRNETDDDVLKFLRFDSTNEPTTMLLPVDAISEMQFEDSCIKDLGNPTRVLDKKWQCPWGYGITDYVAPVFRNILEENFMSLSSATLTINDVNADHVRWWSHRMRLNNYLANTLKNIEDSWFGPWKCLLLGHRLSDEHIESVSSSIITDLDKKFKFEVNPVLIKAILGGSVSVDEVQELYELPQPADRDPVILVLDVNVQTNPDLSASATFPPRARVLPLLRDSSPLTPTRPLLPLRAPMAAAGSSTAAAAAKLRDETLLVAKRLEDEASSLRSTNSERSQQLEEAATILKSAADAQEHVRAAADALDKERAAADALEQQAMALRTRVRTEFPDADAEDTYSASSETEAVTRLHSQAAAVQNIKNLIPIVLDLQASNYSKWRGYVLLILGRFALKEHVLSNVPRPYDPAWSRMDCVVLSWIFNTISADLLDVIHEHNAPTAREAWLGLEQQFLNNRESRAMLLDSEFRTLCQGALSVDDYCRKMKSMADALADLGEPVLDRTLVLNVLRGLNERF